MTRWWLWSLTVWLVFGVLDGTQAVVGMRAMGMHHPWGRLFAFYACSWALWAAVSPLVFLLAKRQPPPDHWIVHGVSYLGIGIVNGIWLVWLESALEPMGYTFVQKLTFVNAVLSFFYSRFHLDLIAYAAVLALAHTLESRRTLAQRDAQLSKARLDALRRQLEPHFLFNTLNSIAGLVRGGKSDTAVRMIAGLSDLLRRVVDGPDGTETSLAEEIEFLDKYLEIQQMRFGSRLRFQIAVPEDLTRARVPSMILQPIVENAIEHGVGRRLEGGMVTITAVRVNGSLKMSVENDGPTLGVFTEGVGIANTRSRLNSLYGNRADFTLRNSQPGKIEATVSVPYECIR